MTYETMILAAAKAAKVSGTILLAICTHETGLKNTKLDYDGGSPTYGICQIKYGSAAIVGYRGEPEGLMDPKTNAKYAAKYLRYQYNRYYGNWLKAVAAYNAGKFNEDKNKVGCPRNIKYLKHVQEKVKDYMRFQLYCKESDVHK